MYSIGIIAVPASLNNIMQIGEQLQRYCNVTFLSYTSKRNLVTTYQQNLSHYDAFLFGGSYTYHLLRESVSSIEKPFDFFEIEDRDYYRIIAELAIERPGIDFSRVYMDRPGIPVDFETIFHVPGIPPILPDCYPEGFYEGTWGNSLAQYQEVWDSHSADLIITRFGSMEEELRARGIQYRLLLPSRETMLNTFWNLMKRLETHTLQEASTCIGMVEPLTDTEDARNIDDRLLLLRQALHSYDNSVGNLYLISENGMRLELTTTTTTLQEFTRGFTVCPLLAQLQRTLSFPVSIGWGCGADVIDAYRNAERALALSARHRTFASYAITDDARVIGPLASSIHEGNHPPASLIMAERQSYNGITARNLSAIKQLMQHMDEPILSAQELADTLHVTVRSAARILRHMEELGVAQSFYNKTNTRVGRPVKYYRFDRRLLLSSRE